MAAAQDRLEVAQEAVGETHVYQLPGLLTIEPSVPVTTALFPRSSAPVVQELIVPGVLPWRGWMGQNPEPNRAPVQVWYTIKRATKTAFGDRPLPAGTVQLYQADSSGRVQLIGEASNDHTAPGRDLRLHRAMRSTLPPSAYRPIGIKNSCRRFDAACRIANA